MLFIDIFLIGIMLSIKKHYLCTLATDSNLSYPIF